MPVDAEPHASGNVDVVFIGGIETAIVLGPADAVAAQAAGHKLYRSHFSTCPDAGHHRRRQTEPARALAKPQEGQVICDACS